MSARKMGKEGPLSGKGPLSRRGFLRTTAQSAAAAIAAGSIVGCESKTAVKNPSGQAQLANNTVLTTAPTTQVFGGKQPEIRPPGLANRRMTADEGDYAVAGYMEQVLGLDKTNDGTTLGNRPDGIHRVQLMTNGTGNDPLYFQLMGTEAEAPGALMNTPFTYTYEGTTRTLPRKYRQASIPQGHAIKAGDWAKYNATTNLPGTAGWNLRLMNGTTAGVVCMSAFHAISPTPTPDPVNPPRVQLYTAGGAAPAANAWVWYYRQLVLPPNDNLFDLALARYDFPQQADNMCVVCPAGSPHAVQPYDYPMAIARNVATSASNTSSELYHRTGGSTPCCGEGQCIGVGAAAAVNLWGTRYLFRSCLVFDPIATVGDSGAIMVRNSDGKAAGLHFCGDPPSENFAGDAISCRLELLGWARQADFQVPGGVLLPTFQQ